MDAAFAVQAGKEGGFYGVFSIEPDAKTPSVSNDILFAHSMHVETCCQLYKV